MSTNCHVGGFGIRVRGSGTTFPTEEMVLDIRGARPEYIRNGVRILKYDQLHARWMRTWNRNGRVAEPDEMVERWAG